MRRGGITVALIGADGAGKTTLAHRLTEKLPGPTLYLYLGINPDASSTALPTTRAIRAFRRSRGNRVEQGGPRQFTTKHHGERDVASLAGSALRLVRGWVRLLNLLLEEWYRQRHARRAKAQGTTVILDRHFFFDYYAHDVTDLSGRRSPLRRIHGWFLSLLPLPDLVLLLDAPPNVLYARKPEGSPADVARRRGEFLEISKAFGNVRRVNAARPRPEVEQEVIAIISDELLRRGIVRG